MGVVNKNQCGLVIFCLCFGITNIYDLRKHHGAPKWEKSGNTEKTCRNVFIMAYYCILSHFQVFLDVPLTKKIFRFFHRQGYRCEKIENFLLFSNSIKTFPYGKSQAKNTILMLKKLGNNVKSQSLEYFRYGQLNISRHT